MASPAAPAGSRHGRDGTTRSSVRVRGRNYERNNTKLICDINYNPLLLLQPSTFTQVFSHIWMQLGAILASIMQWTDARSSYVDFSEL